MFVLVQQNFFSVGEAVIEAEVNFCVPVSCMSSQT